MITRCLLLVVLFLLPLCAPAARAQTAPLAGVTVNGHAEIQVKPDVAYVTLGVVTQSRDQAEAVRVNATRTQAVTSLLVKSGIPDKDIQTDNYTIDPQYDYRNKPVVLTGYQVTDTLRVTVHNLPKLGIIIDKAVQAGANQANGVTFDLADRSKTQDEALAEAVADARRKADLMAGAAGVALGHLISLTETTSLTQPAVEDQAAAPPPPSAQPATPITPQQITVSEDVTAIYAIG